MVKCSLIVNKTVNKQVEQTQFMWCETQSLYRYMSRSNKPTVAY